MRASGLQSLATLALACCVVRSAQAAPVSYTTNFDLDEAPLSDNGAWHHDGLDWTKVEAGSGFAYGTQSGTAGYDDSYAYLSGFPADHSASAVIHRESDIDGSCTHEVELLLRWADAAHSARGYECNVAFDGSYAQIVRWNGPFGNFTYLDSGSVPGGIHDGDRVSAAIVGQTITLSINGKQVARATDATYAAGNPGMGFWRGGPCGSKHDYAFTSFSATSATTATTATDAPLKLSKRGMLLIGLLGAGWLVFGLVRRKRTRAARSPSPGAAP